MQSIATPLNQLHEDCSWFARNHALRVLVVQTSGDMHKTVVSLLPKYEFHADNLCFWMSFEDEDTGAADGWDARTSRLRLQWEQRRQAFALEQLVLPPLDGFPTTTPPGIATPGIADSTAASPAVMTRETFAAVLEQLLTCLPPPVQGVVLLLAPVTLTQPARLEDDLILLLQQPTLNRMRLILVLDSDVPVPQRLLTSLKEKALLTHCIVASSAMEADLSTLVEGLRTPIAALRSAVAAPRSVLPPKRIDAPPPLDPAIRDARLQSLGIHPEYLSRAPELQALILGAALAMTQGNASSAVQLQQQSVLTACELQMHDIDIICRITWASYLVSMSHSSEALQVLNQAIEHAQLHTFPLIQCQALLARGLIQALQGASEQAEASYVKAALSAEQARGSSLAMESWRMAGQIALDARRETQAIAHFHACLRVGEEGQPAPLPSETAIEVSRRLALLYRMRGSHPQAIALEAQAEQLEHELQHQGAPVPATALGESSSTPGSEHT